MLQNCQAVSGQQLECVLPQLQHLAADMSHTELALLQYDVHIDNWNMSLGTLTPNDLDYEPIRVYRDPYISGFEGGGQLIQYTGADMEVTVEVRVLTHHSQVCIHQHLQHYKLIIQRISNMYMYCFVNKKKTSK